ncbi:MAG: hydrogenase expression/formation protein HypE [candidate division Zixibacteria bacterium]|nr:hydrogenase expression/formation protein HypE [candidate division Zixibacteria bacterium]MBU2625727.1 hydrogenase expression/formation protein HypE [candidate division Zixibacteria bacterium]
MPVMKNVNDKSTDVVQLAHGGGGRMMHQLISEVFASIFDASGLDCSNDAALLPGQQSRIVFTTDSYVVDPLFFPGGDIGCLAVYGTVNDLAMRGARPAYMSVGFIVEEGFPINDLKRIAESMRASAQHAGISIVTGDTKVVDRGHGHGLFINTAGIGFVDHDLVIGVENVQPDDAIVLSGDIGRHGLAVMACRQELALETSIESDCASLAEPILKLIDARIDIHCLRDLTRGGLASALVEISESCRAEIVLNQAGIKVLPQVAAACEILGLDPLYVANEGRFVLFLPAEQVNLALEVIDRSCADSKPVVAGRVSAVGNPRVILRNEYGTERVIDMLSGDQLPRIC